VAEAESRGKRGKPSQREERKRRGQTEEAADVALRSRERVPGAHGPAGAKLSRGWAGARDVIAVPGGRCGPGRPRAALRRQRPAAAGSARLAAAGSGLTFLARGAPRSRSWRTGGRSGPGRLTSRRRAG
jgi:hypothetical protein